MRLCKITGRKLLIYWENNQYLGCDFNDLFENNIEQISSDELKNIKHKNTLITRDVIEEGWEAYDYLIIDSWKFQFLPGEIPEDFAEVYSSNNGANIDFEFERIPEDIRKKLLTELFSLKPKKKIADFVDKFVNESGIKNCIGLQIRRGDNRFTVDGREKVSSDAKFINIIESLPKERFYLSTDGYDTLLLLKEKYGNKIIAYPEKEIKRREKESVINGFKAMLILSRTKRLYGSYLSTFSEMAWWYSECKIPINIVGIEDVKNDARPNTLFNKLTRKIKFYKVNLQRWLFRSYG